MNPREQGDLGERSAMYWLMGIGAHVYIPLGHSPDVDLVADLHGQLLRVQVKTGTYFRNGRWDIIVCTRGGNQSWDGLVKKLDASRYDYLFVHVGDGRRWFIPSHAIGAGQHLLLGGPKYAQFEVEPGDPLPARTPAKPASTIELPSRGDARAVKGIAL